jgi:hypothetical protein
VCGLSALCRPRKPLRDLRVRLGGQEKLPASNDEPSAGEISLTITLIRNAVYSGGRFCGKMM